jgi:hypothetical protein
MLNNSQHLVQSGRLLQGKCLIQLGSVTNEPLTTLDPALESASTEAARCSVLTLALFSFQHNDEQVHNEELKIGADSIICKCLRRSVAITVESRETDRLIGLLEAIYKCSDTIAASSFCRHGAVLFPVLVTIASSSTPYIRSKMAATRLLRRTKPEGVSLAQMLDADLLLIAIVRFLRNGLADCQNNALLALDCITLNHESKPIVARFPGLLEAVVQSAVTCERGAMVVLQNVALDSRNKETILKTRGFLKLLQRSSASNEVGIRCNASAALLYLSSDNSINEQLVTFQSGTLVANLADMLQTGGCETQLRALQTISNLISASTAEAIGNVSTLMEQLGDLGSSSPPTDCSVLAAKAIKRLSTYMCTRHKGHQPLCDALVRMSKSPDCDVCLWTARAYVEQSLSASHSFFMVRSEAAIGGLLLLATCKHRRVRNSAIEALANLSQEPANARRLSAHESLVDILVKCVNRKDSTYGSDVERREAVRAILLIANHSSSTKRLAQHHGIIESLSRYGTSVDGDVELKRAALHCVLVLAPSI